MMDEPERGKLEMAMDEAREATFILAHSRL